MVGEFASPCYGGRWRWCAEKLSPNNKVIHFLGTNMDVAILLDKFNKNLIALLVGASVSAAGTWSIAENLHKKETAILERELADYQKRLSESDATLKAAKQTSKDIISPDRSSAQQKTEIEALVKKLDVEIASKKVELIRHSPIMVDGPKDDSFLRVEEELRSLQNQRDEARLRLIQVVGK
jgi:hypothetical protein